jgi:hypothetical protein
VFTLPLPKARSMVASAATLTFLCAPQLAFIALLWWMKDMEGNECTEYQHHIQLRFVFLMTFILFVLCLFFLLLFFFMCLLFLYRYTASYVPLVSGKYTARSILLQRGGLDATYFGSRDFTQPLETRQDSQINFDWGLYQYNAPSNKLPDDPV